MKSRVFQQYDQSLYMSQEYLTHIKELTPIPTNCVIDKTLPGLGATFSEIKAERNSIIIVPNVSIILNKHEQHTETLAIWKDTTTKKIKDYISSNLIHKKFLSTPEGYKRIVKLLADMRINPFTDYFLLIDESHKITKDVGFRFRITEPMKDFFKYSGKALISSTPITPSDPRFYDRANPFKFIKINPRYNYQEPLNVIHVNNILTALKTYLAQNPNTHYCIFFNTINGIKELITKLNIEKESRIFCSQESAREINNECPGLANHAFSSYLKYNFFTSSFYNGLDINMDQDPDIIILTDANALQTAIDPFTDSIQIIGRFRKRKLNDGTKVKSYNKATHLYTTNWRLNTLDADQVKCRIEAERYIYQAIKGLMIAAPNSALDGKLNNYFVQSLKKCFYSQFLSDGILDYFKVDNFSSEERVKGYYISQEALKTAYNDKYIKAFDLKFNDWVLIPQKLDHLKLRAGKRFAIDRVRKVVAALKAHENDQNSDEYRELIREYTHHANDVLQAYKKLGFDRIVELKYKIADMRKAVLKLDFEEKRDFFPVIRAMQSAFPLNMPLTNRVIKTKINAIYKDYAIERNATAKDIEYFFYFKIVSKDKGRSVRGYILTEYRHTTIL